MTMDSRDGMKRRKKGATGRIDVSRQRAGSSQHRKEATGVSAPAKAALSNGTPMALSLPWTLVLGIHATVMLL